MVVVRNLVLVLVLFSCFTVQAQSKIDSLRQIWENEDQTDSIRFNAFQTYYSLYSFSEPKNTFKIVEEHLELAKEKNIPKNIVKALLEKVKLHYIEGDNDKAMEHIYLALDYAPLLKNPNDLANIYYFQGNLYSEENKFQKSIRTYSSALEIYKEQKSKSGEAGTLNNIGILYQIIGNYDLALEYFDESLVIFRQIKSFDVEGDILVNIGDVKIKQNKPQDAISYAHQALNSKQVENSLVLEAECYFLLAMAYEQLNNLDSANFYTQKSLLTDLDIQNESKIKMRKTFLAKLAFEKNVVAATSQGEAILRSIIPTDKKELKEAIYDLMYKCYKAQGQSDKALEMHELHTIYRDSLHEEKSNFSLIREAVKKEFEEKLDRSHQKQSKLKYGQFIILGASGLLITILLFYFRRKSKNENKEKKVLLTELENIKAQVILNQNTQSEDKMFSNDDNREPTNANDLLVHSAKVSLDRKKLEGAIDRKLNETDWNVLNILLEDPVITNKGIAERAFMSVDGIGSSLRRMYEYFEIAKTKYKKIALLSEVIKISNE